MNAERASVWVTVLVIAGVAVISGPLVSSVDLATDPRGDDLFCDPTGTANVTVESVPETSFTLKKQGFGTDAYDLDDEPVTVTVSDVEGCVVLSHELEIPALGFSSVKFNYVSPDSQPRQQLTTTGGTFDSRRITQDSYRGMLVVELRGATNRTLYRGNFTIDVED